MTNEQLIEAISETRKQLLHHSLVMVELLVERGIITPEEYQRKLDSTVGEVDQIWTEKLEMALTAAKAEAEESMSPPTTRTFIPILERPPPSAKLP